MPDKPTRPWLPFVVPYALFIVLTTFDRSFAGHYPLVYTVKVAICAVAAWLLRPRPAEAYGLKPGRLDLRAGLLAAGLGLVLTVVWVAADKITPHMAILGTRDAYNPFREIGDPTARALFIAIRFAGLVLLVPWIEELFFRGFLLRYIADPADWAGHGAEVFGFGAALINVLLFSTLHPEWLSATIFAASMAALLRVTKDVRACVVAHAVCNLALGIYVITQGAWIYW